MQLLPLTIFIEALPDSIIMSHCIMAKPSFLKRLRKKAKSMLNKMLKCCIACGIVDKEYIPVEIYLCEVSLFKKAFRCSPTDSIF